LEKMTANIFLFCQKAKLCQKKKRAAFSGTETMARGSTLLGHNAPALTDNGSSRDDLLDSANLLPGAFRRSPAQHRLQPAAMPL
jgi:hypothetical protein